MSAFVYLEPSGSRVAFATDITFERLLASMDQLVGLQVSLSDELLATAVIRACKRSLSRLQT